MTIPDYRGLLFLYYTVVNVHFSKTGWYEIHKYIHTYSKCLLLHTMPSKMHQIFTYFKIIYFTSGKNVISSSFICFLLESAILARAFIYSVQLCYTPIQYIKKME